ncbi:50S ribosomal protein L25 [Candidatus Saccharibacteria bacterium]|nr:50S ribosomal protein L25 [Candidatus Saccharibacteria bacterium]
MSDYNLSLSVRTETGKKALALREEGLVPSVIYGGKSEILAKSPYNETEKVLKLAGYHSPIDLTVDDKKTMAIVKSVQLDPVSRRIINVSFQAVSANKLVEATAPIILVNFEASDANKAHLTLDQVLEEIDVKAKPADLPKELTIDASKLATTEDKIFIKDVVLPAGVEFADKELSPETVIANVYDAAAEAAAREEAEKAAAEAQIDAADVPSDNGAKPEEAAEGEETKAE